MATGQALMFGDSRVVPVLWVTNFGQGEVGEVGTPGLTSCSKCPGMLSSETCVEGAKVREQNRERKVVC